MRQNGKKKTDKKDGEPAVSWIKTTKAEQALNVMLIPHHTQY
jgi:hypothetical protein